MNITEFRIYDPLRDYAGIAELWRDTLGSAYPVTHRVLWPRIVGRHTLESGDGWVACQGKRLVGFGLAELDRAVLTGGIQASVQAILVAPEGQRQGIGTALLDRIEKRARAAGVDLIRPGSSCWRFWTGIPEDLPGARAFFRRHGYQDDYAAVDLFGDLTPDTPDDRAGSVLENLGIEAESLTDLNLGAVYDFLSREQPSWRRSMLMMVEAGDLKNVLVFRKGTEWVGSIQTYTPASRYRGANVVWEGRYRPGLGGFGAVLIAKAWRGKGLGAALCQAAARHIRQAGATGCYIDWTNRTLSDKLYSKVGTSICTTFAMCSKKLSGG